MLSKSVSSAAAVNEAPVEYTLSLDKGLLAKMVSFCPVVGAEEKSTVPVPLVAIVTV